MPVRSDAQRPRSAPGRLFGVGLSLALAGCGERADAAPLNAVLITLDTTRADALAPYGAPPDRTPYLALLAEQSVVYEEATTVAPLTLPAHASILTGLYPPRHGVRDNGAYALAPAATTVAEVARELGAQTAAFVAAAVLDPGFGLDQGFDVYEAPARPFTHASSTYAERRGSEVAARALDWLEGRDPTRPFFLWMHLFDPHAPYDPPPAFAAHEGSPYAGEVAAADAALGRLLARLEAEGLLERTFVVVVADHGEAFGEHGEVSHASLCYDTTLRVPLLLRYPDGWGAGRRSREIVSVVDVAPTLMRALGATVPAGIADLDGASLYRRTVAPDRGVYFESYYGYLNFGWSPITGWRDALGKYVHSSRPELYETHLDPDETSNLVEKAGEGLARYRAGLADVAAREPLQASAAPGRLGQALARLGYAQSTAAPLQLPGPLAPSELPAPADRLDEQLAFQEALGLQEEGRWEEADARLRAIVGANPRNVAALDRLAAGLAQLARCDEALGVLRSVVAVGPPRADAWCRMGGCLLEEQRAEAALDAFERALDLDPAHPQALAGAVLALERLDRGAEAEPLRARLREVQER